MNSSEFDRRFDAGDSVLEALDLDGARPTRVKQKCVNVDFPLWMVEQVDHEATRLGVTRQSIIKVWLAELTRVTRFCTHPTSAAVLRATCSSTRRACSTVAPGKISTNSTRETPSSRVSKRAAIGIRVSRNTQASLPQGVLSQTADGAVSFVHAASRRRNL
jgi:hypothetical protein